jgi:hypothetical protein
MGACGGRASGGGGEVRVLLPPAAPGVDEGSSARRRGRACVRTSGERAGHTLVCPPSNLMSRDSLFRLQLAQLTPTNHCPALMVTHLETASRCGDEAVILAAAVPDYARSIQACGRRTLAAREKAR